MQTADRGPPRLDMLPPELLLKVLAHLPPRAVALLGRTNRVLHQISQTESVWKSIVLDIHRLDSCFVLPDEAVLRAAGSWADQARFLLPRAKDLGYWASSQPYSSRILRIKTQYAHSPSKPAQCTLQIIGEQLVPSNLLENPSYTPDPPMVLPSAAIGDGPTPRSGYVLPRQGTASHSPDAGLHIELLHESFSWSPVFVVTAERGARLPNDSAVGPGSLRLRLERTVSAVGTLAELERESEEDDRDERRTRTAAMLSLFAGRPPKRAWPTVHLYGGEAILPPRASSRANSNQLRFKGAMRGLHDIIDGTTRPVVEHVTLPPREPPSPSWPGSDFDDSNRFKSHCEGFHIVAVRAVSPSQPGTPASSTRSSTHGSPVPGTSQVIERRLGVGRDGGPAILWHGRERDPEESRPRVTIIRAGGGEDGVGGLVFRMEHTAEIGSDTRPQTDEQAEEDMLEEVVRTEREDFFPLLAPATELGWDGPPATNAHGDILAASLEGLWVGTYGQAHGLEMGHITVKLTREGYRTLSGEARVRLTRAISFVKVTGDENVGSGQISWTAILDPIELEPGSPFAEDGFARSDAELELALGTVPSVTNAELVRWTDLDPTQPGAEQPRWDAGSVAGAGQIALVGFVHRSWTGAIVTFIRSRRTLRRERAGMDVVERVDAVETKKVEVVDEIRVRWKELGCVSVFKRVRIGA